MGDASSMLGFPKTVGKLMGNESSSSLPPLSPRSLFTSLSPLMKEKKSVTFKRPAPRRPTVVTTAFPRSLHRPLWPLAFRPPAPLDLPAPLRPCQSCLSRVLLPTRCLAAAGNRANTQTSKKNFTPDEKNIHHTMQKHEKHTKKPFLNSQKNLIKTTT